MTFSLSLANAVRKRKGDTEKIMRGTLLSICSQVIKSTPVGDPSLWESSPPKGYIGGTLRGAWNASINQPDLSISNSKDQQGQQTISSVGAIIAALEVGQTFYLANPQPYAMRVEYGWSRKQRPQGMLRVAIANANRYLNEQAAKTRR